MFINMPLFVSVLLIRLSSMALRSGFATNGYNPSRKPCQNNTRKPAKMIVRTAVRILLSFEF